MSRKGPAPKRAIIPDPRFKNIRLAKFMNMLMRGGKKGLAERIVYGALDIVSQRTGKDPLVVFQDAMENTMPLVEVRARRVGGATYQVPIEVKRSRQQALAFRWLLEVVRKKKGRPTAIFLSDEILAAYNKEGAAMTIRENTHKMADANKMNAHFAW